MTQFKIHSEVRTTPGDDSGSVLINLTSGKVFSLNGMGAKIWTKLEDRLPFETIVDSLAQQYDVSPKQLRTDLETFLYELEKKGLVEPTKGANHGIGA